MKKILFIAVIALLLPAASVIMLTAQSHRPIDSPLPPPTLTPSTDQALLDKEQQERQNVPIKPRETATPYPGEIIPVFPTTVLGFSSPTPVAYEPNDNLTTYTDINFGFSFAYPVNWVLDAPVEKLDKPLMPYEVFLTNFNPEMQIKSNPPEGNYIKMQFVVLNKSTVGESVERWLRSSYHPDTQFAAIEETANHELNMQRWIATGPTLPQTIAIVGLSNETSVYIISYSPAKTKYASTIEKIIASFVAP